MAWRVDPRTGEQVWVADGDEATMGATTAAPNTGQSTQGQAPPREPAGFGQGLQEGFERTFGSPEGWLRGIAGTFDGQSPESGSTIGAGVGNRIAQATAPQLSFGDEIRPEDQAYLDALQGLQTTLGTPTNITAPTLPEVPAAMFEVDPGLEQLVTHAENRRGQVDQLIAQLRGDREAEVGQTTSKWSTLARWLGQVASADDLSQGGVIMERVLRDNQDMRDELRQETLQYIQMGMSAEDAVVQAQVALLSGQASARREQAAAGYQRDTAQTQLNFGAQTANAEATGRSASARAQAIVALAEAEREARERARSGRNTAAQALSGDPRYAEQAFGVMAENATGDPATQEALTGVMQEQQLNMALMSYVAQYAGTNNREALRFLQQWDPRLRPNELQNMTPQQLMLRLTRSPNASRAFQTNRDYLIRSQQFGSMMQPAQ